MKNVHALRTQPANDFNPASFDASQAGAQFAIAIEETARAVYVALESIARGIEINHKCEEARRDALTAFLKSFDAAYLVASEKRQTTILLTKTKRAKLSDGEKADITARAKNVTKAAKSLYKKALEIRLFKNGGAINCAPKEYNSDFELADNGTPKKPKKPVAGKPASPLISTGEMCKSLEGFKTLLAAVLDGGVAAGNPEVIARAESIKAFLAGAADSAKPKARKTAKPKTLGASLAEVAA